MSKEHVICPIADRPGNRDAPSPAATDDDDDQNNTVHDGVEPLGATCEVAKRFDNRRYCAVVEAVTRILLAPVKHALKTIGFYAGCTLLCVYYFFI